MSSSIIVLLISLSFGFASPPVDPSHPGSASYSLDYRRHELKISGRSVVLYLPVGATVKVPVILFGHGQAMNHTHYDQSFQHYAKKGVAVIHPMFDKGFFDQDWRRMAKDFNALSYEVFKQYPELDQSAVIYSGHSKGAYVSLMAAGEQGNSLSPKAGIFFAPAGYDKQYLQQMNADLPITLVWGQADSIIKKNDVWEIYQKSPAKYKQFIEVKNYSGLKADHFLAANKGTFFGGTNGVTAYHYFGSWKWLLGTVRDVVAKTSVSNEYVYGSKAILSGEAGLVHEVDKSW